MKRWRIAGINFDHMHMGDNLRMAKAHPQVEIVGICHEETGRMQQTIQSLGIPADRVFTDYRACIEKTKPDIVLLCPATARHGEWTEKIAGYGVHIIIEKPFAASLAEADRMVDAVAPTGKLLAINWPMVWRPSHRTTKRLIDEGVIGEVLEVHYYNGNRGPLWHVADKVEVSAEEVIRQKPASWFYKKDHGGGSLLDYLGYGVTLGTWFQGGRKPIEVTCVVDEPKGLEVDEHSVTVARYAHGLSKFETRWGTFTDPWTHQPQPKCGFVIVGAEGTIGSYDYDQTIRLQRAECPEGRDVPVDCLAAPFQDPIQTLIHCIENGVELDGPLAPAVSRIGQQLVDSAVLSAREKRTVSLVE